MANAIVPAERVSLRAMSQPCIITVAITGSLPGKKDNPAVPIAPAEQVESSHEAFEAGATLVHLHVRDEEGRPTSDPKRFAKARGALRHPHRLRGAVLG